MFSHVTGHNRVLDYLQKLTESGRRAHAYVFIGPPGVGKTTVARAWIKGLLKWEQVLLAHPDYHEIKNEPDGLKPVEAVREMNRFIAQKPFVAPMKIALVQTRQLNENALDALLKTLEEPKGDRLIILITSHADLVSQTILSRCQQVNFDLVSDTALEKWLVELDPGTKDDVRKKIVQAAAGKPGKAFGLLKDDSCLADLRDLQDGVRDIMNGTESRKMQWVQSCFKSIKKDNSVKQEKASEIIEGIEHVLHEKCLNGACEVSENANLLLKQARDALRYNVAPQHAIECLLIDL